MIKKQTIGLLLSVLSSACAGCAPSLGEIREQCEAKFEYESARYNDCVQDSLDNREQRRERLRAIGGALQQMGNGLQQTSSPPVNCTSTCNVGMCYTTCR